MILNLSACWVSVIFPNSARSLNSLYRAQTRILDLDADDSLLIMALDMRDEIAFAAFGGPQFNIRCLALKSLLVFLIKYRSVDNIKPKVEPSGDNWRVSFGS